MAGMSAAVEAARRRQGGRA
ncbi:MAG: hypothetical protein ACLSVD_03115 [Eggerthellaceae bacterium]